MDEILKVSALSLYLKGQAKEIKILDNLNFEVFPSEIVAVVGQSGCGKSLFAKSLLKLNNDRVFRTEGKILFDGTDINTASKEEILAIRGRDAGVVFQEPISSLNPTMKIGTQICEPLVKHLELNKLQARNSIEILLGLLGIKNVKNYFSSYPHQLSGGMAQRGMIASASCCKPKLIIADEPTSALDSLSQSAIVKLIKDLNREYGMSVIFITHDMELAHMIANRVAVMDNGSIVETGETKHVFNSPKNEATKQLLESILINPAEYKNDELAGYCDIRNHRIPLLEIINLKKYFKDKTGGVVKAVNGISMEILKGETLGIIGESGCGKSTLARLLIRLIKPDSGSVLFAGTDIWGLKNYPKLVQMVFQDPLSSLDPRMRVRDIITEGLDINRQYKHDERGSIAEEFLKRVGLDGSFLSRFPHELSGGQRQRISIARSLVMKPEFIVLDEPTSYLDTVSQKQILELFIKIKEELNLTYVFVTHNIKALSKMCDRIAVMLEGKIVESGNTGDILKNPLHPYTRKLLSLQESQL